MQYPKANMEGRDGYRKPDEKGAVCGEGAGRGTWLRDVANQQGPHGAGGLGSVPHLPLSPPTPHRCCSCSLVNLYWRVEGKGALNRLCTG